MNVKNAFKICGASLVIGIAFRIYSILYFFDESTGFYNGKGIISWCSFAFTILSAAITAVMCIKDKKTFFAPYSGSSSRLLSFSAFISGAVALAAGIILGKEFLELQKLPQPSVESGFQNPLSSKIYMLLIISLLAYGLLQLILFIPFLKGANPFKKAPALYLFSVIWGVCNLLFVFVYYSRSALKQENYLTIFSAALLLLSVYYLSRYFAGVGKERSARFLFVFGFPAVIITSVQTGADLLNIFVFEISTPLNFLPIMVQASQLAVALFIFSSLLIIRKYDLQEPAGSNSKKSKIYSVNEETAKSSGGRYAAK